MARSVLHALQRPALAAGIVFAALAVGPLGVLRAGGEDPKVPPPPGIGDGTGTGIPDAFSGRQGAMREKLLKEGASMLSEAAVARGLKWLALHQAKDGHWGLHDFNHHARDKVGADGKTFTCTCDGTSGRRDDVAATGLALLPFLGAGVTHKNPKATVVDYSKTVEGGLNWLMKKQAVDGSFSGAMYTHAIATIAICEAYGLSSDPRLKPSAQKAINFIVGAQDPTGGGWRYAPRQSPGDTSVTGWQFMALKSGQMAGLTVPRAASTSVEKFIDSVEDTANKGRYVYTAGSPATPSMTAVGLLCREYLGTNPRNPGLVKGCEFLLEAAPPGKTNNIYYEYYATQVFHHMNGEFWTTWNEGKDGKGGMRDYLIQRQERNTAKRDHIEGSFPIAGDVWGREGSRIMTTSLSLLCLEVYYRHLPLYRRDVAPPKDKD
jgi:hypothetical protein